MPKEIKLSDFEIKKIKKTQADLQQFQIQFGEVHIQTITLEQQEVELQGRLKKLQEDYLETQKKFQNQISELTEKYGNGQLNLDTGTFIPNEEPKAEPKEN